MNKKTINKIKEIILPILLKYGIKHAGIFGSAVRGEITADSDIDILVEISKDAELDLLDFVHIKHELENALKRGVDLIEYSTIKPALKENISKEEVTIL
ncbi:MAG: nucleotidyltransferase domain-containing protein [Spirochaetes bacterium]|nr:nucleotidyltransferase domain-containing protein [Spirochaetota bacterium]MCK5568594.1 nucleotidyltransferase domain-containing protein [Spirochaetota bacterium]